tara:strand:+ start:2929 stop:3606 length:678 start_codon:yes stop_codon:yes gene_type:complete
MILVFDLDDTLFPEISFVKSGFKAVSNFLSNEFQLNKKQVYSHMILLLKKNGRGNVFDDVLKANNIYTKKTVIKCLSLYRKHNPNIKLYYDAEKCIDRFKAYKKYIITDGNVNVQRSKVKALGISKKFVKVIPTYQYGISFSKPSVKCFQLILEKEKSQPKDMIYIGDNPHKDFVKIKKVGIKTLRLVRGAYKDVRLDSEFEADYTFKNLKSLTHSFLGKINEDR